MSEMHDFKDGKGPVPAHKHTNGGGWVSDDSSVGDDCFVDETSTVRDCSTVSGGSTVRDCSTVSDGSTVRDWSTVSDGSTVRDWSKDYQPPRMQIGRWSANQVSKDEIRIGCVFFGRDKWNAEYIAKIADEHKATDAEIVMAVMFVLCIRKLEGMDP